MYTAAIILIIILSIFLVFAVLVQNSKGGGLSNQFSGNSSQLMGVKKTSDLLEQITWGLAIGVMVLILSTSFLLGQPSEEGIRSPNIDSAQENRALPQSLPGASQTQPATAPATKDSASK